MVSREEVVYAYRLLLGREPESDAAIEGHRGAADWTALRGEFIHSPEYMVQTRQSAVVSALVPDMLANVLAEPARVDVQIPEPLFDRLLQDTQRAWEGLGAEKPHWSVITNPIFLPDQIDANREEFYDSGMQSWQFCERAMARAGKELTAEWTAFELGCGVGRVTAQLARYFRRVIGCDISRAHLDIARMHLAGLAAGNVELLHLTGIAELAALEPVEFFYSVIVLQHNPPPVIHRLLQILLEKVRAGGCAYFQVPVSWPGYSFSIDEYLARPAPAEPIMETHLLPQADLFRLLDENRFRILDLQQDLWQPPPLVSFSILAEKMA